MTKLLFLILFLVFGQEKVSISSIREEYCSKSTEWSLTDQSAYGAVDIEVSLMAISRMPQIQEKVILLTAQNKDKFNVSEADLEFYTHKKLIKVINKNCTEYQKFLLRELGPEPLKNSTLSLTVTAENVRTFLDTTTIKSEISLYRKIKEVMLDAYYKSPSKVLYYDSHADYLEEAKVYLSHRFEKFLIIYAIHIQLQQLYVEYDKEMPGSFGFYNYEVNFDVDKYLL